MLRILKPVTTAMTKTPIRVQTNAKSLTVAMAFEPFGKIAMMVTKMTRTVAQANAYNAFAAMGSYRSVRSVTMVMTWITTTVSGTAAEPAVATG